MSTQNSFPLADAKMQVGNGYYLDFDQMARLLNASVQDNRGRIPQADLAAAIGMANRKVENLGSLASLLGLIRKGSYKPTPLGSLIQKCDPFFDDLGTLWFLHYIIGSDPRAIIWNRIVNNIIPQQLRFTREHLRANFDDLREWFSADSIKKHVLKEINTFLDAYTNQSFARLAYLRAEDEWYALGYRQLVPPLVLAASIAHFRDARRAGDTAVSIPDLCTAPNSPGVVYQLPEDRLRAMLEELKNQPGISLESRADLDQLRLSPDLTDIELMKRYYDSR
jgi:hypothetical protein